MKLILTQPEIEAVLKAHVLNTVQLHGGQSIDIEFSATRGDAGITASIDIPYQGLASLDLSTQLAKDVPAMPPATPVSRRPAKASAAAPAAAKKSLLEEAPDLLEDAVPEVAEVPEEAEFAEVGTPGEATAPAAPRNLFDS